MAPTGTVLMADTMAMEAMGTDTAAGMGAETAQVAPLALRTAGEVVRAPDLGQVRLAALLEAVRVIIGTRRERTDLWMDLDAR